MTKVALTALAFALMVAFANVSGYRTTITTTITNGHGSSFCIPRIGCLPDGLDEGKSATINNEENGSEPKCVTYHRCTPEGTETDTRECITYTQCSSVDGLADNPTVPIPSTL
nr:PawS(-)alb.b [Gaillardia pulchella]